MPSVPQSLLWISLVVLWLFVLVPMLISKRDAVRRTSDLALATRVLNGGAARRLRRGKPAAGHRSDPDWQPGEEPDDELDDEVDTQRPRKAVVVAAIDDTADTEPNYIDVHVVGEDSGALPVGSAEPAQDPQVVRAAAEPGVADGEGGGEEDGRAESDELPDGAPESDELSDGTGESEELPDGTAESEELPDGTADEYEYVEDTSGLESADDPPTTTASRPSRRRRYDSAAAAAAISARKYKFRKRVVAMLVLALVGCATAAYTVWPQGWWACGSVGAVTVLYLGYLRRQTRIEQQLRRRRAQRMARSRLGVENTADRTFDVTPSRLRRPGAAVLEIDDEDPIFEHLDYAPGPGEYHLPRAAGE
ncbi:MAG: hypothetical protein JO152_09175 [Mycobacteriaceae bacterium]|nr:hypothetical protein [Mycobacteriaceae bacterium]